MLPKAASIWEFPQGTDFTITASESKITVKFKDGESSRVITIGSEEPDLSSDFTAPSPADVYFESKDKGEKTKLTAQDVAEIKYLHAQLLERKQWTIRQTICCCLSSTSAAIKTLTRSFVEGLGHVSSQLRMLTTMT